MQPFDNLYKSLLTEITRLKSVDAEMCEIVSKLDERLFYMTFRNERLEADVRELKQRIAATNSYIASIRQLPTTS